MKDFFHGWRRKAGCVTLVMASAVTMMWARGYLYIDWIQVGYRRRLALRFWAGSVDCMSWTAEPDLPQHFVMWDSDELPAPALSELMEFLQYSLMKNNIAVQASTVPLWPIAVSLTLLSVYLLLSKPGWKRGQVHGMEKGSGPFTDC